MELVSDQLNLKKDLKEKRPEYKIRRLKKCVTIWQRQTYSHKKVSAFPPLQLKSAIDPGSFTFHLLQSVSHHLCSFYHTCSELSFMF